MTSGDRKTVFSMRIIHGSHAKNIFLTEESLGHHFLVLSSHISCFVFLPLFILTGILKQNEIILNYSLLKWTSKISKLESEWSSCRTRLHMTVLYAAFPSAVSAVLRTTLRRSFSALPERSPALLRNESLQSLYDSLTVQIWCTHAWKNISFNPPKPIYSLSCHYRETHAWLAF